MSLSIYHGNEEWILKGLAVDLHKSISQLFPNLHVERFESFTDIVGKTKYHFFVQQGQLHSFVKKNGSHLLGNSICLFTHFDLKQFPVEILNQFYKNISQS